MKLTEQYVRRAFRRAWEMLSKLRIGKNEKWNDAVSRSTDQLRIEYCDDQNGTIILHSCDTRPQPWRYYQSKPVFSKQILLSWQEPIFHMGSSSNCKSILED